MSLGKGFVEFFIGFKRSCYVEFHREKEELDGFRVETCCVHISALTDRFSIIPKLFKGFSWVGKRMAWSDLAVWLLDTDFQGSLMLTLEKLTSRILIVRG